jgi:hypothetical protein
MNVSVQDLHAFFAGASVILFAFAPTNKARVSGAFSLGLNVMLWLAHAVGVM